MIAAKLSSHPIDTAPAQYAICNLLYYVVAYGIAAIFYFRRVAQSALIISRAQIVVPIILLSISAQIMNMLVEVSALEPLHLLYYRMYSIIICASTFFIMMNVFETSKMKHEMNVIKEINIRQKEQYEIKKELIDNINIRAHDLKKQIGAMCGAPGIYGGSGLRQAAQELSRYDFMADTGNEVLDVILTDIGLRCEREGIRLTYLLDGRELSFMDPIDIYAIFGNLFDNAIESVGRMKALEKRVISVQMRSIGNMLFFHAFNYYEDELNFEDGIPQTTKEDKENHGFGMKSICMSVKKYGGEMTVTAKDHIFNVNFMLCVDSRPC